MAGDEGDLRRFDALRLHLLQYPADIQVHVGIGRPVGVVENEDVHARIGQHRHVGTDHRRVVGLVVAQPRLAPPVRGVDRAILRVKGICREELSIVVNRDVSDMVRQKIEDGDGLIGTRRADGGRGGNGTSQAVGGNPGITVNIAHGNRPRCRERAEIRQADIDDLRPGDIMAVHGERVPPRQQQPFRANGEWSHVIAAGRTGHSRRQFPIDVYLSIVVMENVKIGVGKKLCEGKRAPEPDVVSGPFRADPADPVSEWGRGRLPAGVTEARLLPATRRGRRGEAPGLGRRL